jgi:SMI1-KNR4 cell-wall
MKTKFIAATQKPTEEKILSVEKSLGLRIPKEYREALLKYGIISVGENIHSNYSYVGIACFLNLAKDENSIEHACNLYRDRIPSEFLPVADAVGGNLILIQIPTQHIYFWDHELEEDKEFEAGYEALTKLNESFDDFLQAMIIPEPIGEVKVVSSWVDPEFVKKMKALGYMK